MKNKYLHYGLWIVGLVVISLIAQELNGIAHQFLNSFQRGYYIALTFITYFVLGGYISIILIPKWKIKMNIPLLLMVTLPCILCFIAQMYIYIPIDSKYISMIIGLTCVKGLFNEEEN